VLDAVAQTVKLVRGTRDADAQALVDRLQAVRTEITGMVTPTPRSRRPPPPKAELARLHQEEERLETELSYRGALVDPDLEPVTLESVQAPLPADAALVDFLVFRPIDRCAPGRRAPGARSATRPWCCVCRATPDGSISVRRPRSTHASTSCAVCCAAEHPPWRNVRPRRPRWTAWSSRRSGCWSPRTGSWR
jgi:hypothetical protein